MEIGKFKLAKAYLVRPPKKPTSEFLTQEQAEAKSPGLFNAEVNENVVTKNYEAEEYINRVKSYVQSKYIDEDFARQLVEKKLKDLEMTQSDLDTSAINFATGGRVNRAIGGGVIEGEDLGTREGFGSPEAIEYLKSLKPGSVVNTYAIGKQFGIAPATVRGQVERNFPELKLQTREESSAIAKETRREQYAQKKSDVPIIQSEVRGKGAAARTKGRDITGVTFPNKEKENKYIKYLEDRYSDVKGRKGPSNSQLAIEFFGEDTKANVAKVEKINRFYRKDLKLDFKPAPVSETKQKRFERLKKVTPGAEYIKGNVDFPFHHIRQIGGEVPLTASDVKVISKSMNSRLAPYNERLNAIADAISKNITEAYRAAEMKEEGKSLDYLKRVDELNQQAEDIVNKAIKELPKQFKPLIGFNKFYARTNEYGLPLDDKIRVERIGGGLKEGKYDKPFAEYTKQEMADFRKSIRDESKNLLTKSFDNIVNTLQQPEFKSILKNSGVTLKGLGQLRQRNVPGFIDTMRKLIKNNPDLRAEIENDYSDIQNYYASASTMSDVPINIEKPDTGIPYEAALPTGVLFGKYLPQVLEGGKQLIKPIVSPSAAAIYSASELFNINPFSEEFGKYKEDGSLSAAGAQLFYPELFKKSTAGLQKVQNIYNRALNLGLPVRYLPQISKGMTGIGAIMIGGDIAQGLAKRIGPDQRGPLTEEELLGMREKETTMAGIANTVELASKIAADQGISYKDALSQIQNETQKYAVGGRVGFFKGAVAGGGNISPGTRADYTPGQGTRDDNPFTGGGGGGGPKEPPKTSAYQKIKALGTVPLNLIGGIFGNPFDPTKPHQVINTKAQMDYLNYLANQKNEDTGTLSYGDYGTQFNLSDLKDPIAFSTAMTMGGTGYKKSDTGDITYTGGTYDFDGAVPFVDQGGLMGWAYRGGEYLANKFNPARLANGGRIEFGEGGTKNKPIDRKSVV